VVWAISRGTLRAPEDSDSDDSSDDESVDNHRDSSTLDINTCESTSYGTIPVSSSGQTDETDPIPGARHSLSYHFSYLFFGFLAISLSGYILSHAATTISDELGLSDVNFGVVILSIATTLPEKFVSVLSGSRGHAGILVANTAGSNVFLITLCLGIIMLDTGGKLGRGNVSIAELGALWLSTVVFTITVWFGKCMRWIGAGMLVAYLTFIVLEFAVFH
jgi:Ca2+/Na+ antiporter